MIHSSYKEWFSLKATLLFKNWAKRSFLVIERSIRSWKRLNRSCQSFLKIHGIDSLMVDLFKRANRSLSIFFKRLTRAIRSQSIFFKDQKDWKIKRSNSQPWFYMYLSSSKFCTLEPTSIPWRYIEISRASNTYVYNHELNSSLLRHSFKRLRNTNLLRLFKIS